MPHAEIPKITPLSVTLFRWTEPCRLKVKLLKEITAQMTSEAFVGQARTLRQKSV